LIYILAFFNFYELVNIECNYVKLGLWAVGIKYRCSVENYLFIDSPEKAQIDGVSGTHMSGKSDNDEIYFHIQSKSVQYLPRGLEKFFKNVTGIAVWYDLLKEIHQSDFKPFQKLECVNIFESKIEIIEENIFDYNPNLVAVSLGKANIFHIGPTVFDHLTKLTSLHLGGNKCINEFKENNREGVEQIIRNLKINCISSEFLNFNKKLKILENSENFAEGLKNFESEFITSKFSNYFPLNEKLQKLKNQKNIELPSTDKPKVESTTPEPQNCSEIYNLTETHQNHSKIDDLQFQNYENLKFLQKLTEDLKTSQTGLFSELDQRFLFCNRQSTIDNITINEKFVEFQTKFGERFESFEKNLSEIKEKLDNFKIDEVEKRMIGKIESILDNKLEKMLKALKMNSTQKYPES